MSLRLASVDFDAQDPDPPSAFWAGMLDRRILREAGGVLLPGDDTQVGLRFVEAGEERPGPNRVHLHLTSSDLDDQRHTVEKAVELGGRIIRQYPDEGHVVMADPDRNEFCVIEPTNNFLSGCRLLGEVTCEGTARSACSLVWDRGQQTAIQSPVGGTKISWDVRPGPPDYGSRRQRLNLVASDPAAEVARLVALGASELGERTDHVVLADPDGGEFVVGRGKTLRPATSRAIDSG